MRLVHKSEFRPGPRVEQLRNLLGVLQLAITDNRMARRTSAEQNRRGKVRVDRVEHSQVGARAEHQVRSVQEELAAESRGALQTKDHRQKRDGKLRPIEMRRL